MTCGRPAPSSWAAALGAQRLPWTSGAAARRRRRSQGGPCAVSGHPAPSEVPAAGAGRRVRRWCSLVAIRRCCRCAGRRPRALFSEQFAAAMTKKRSVGARRSDAGARRSRGRGRLEAWRFHGRPRPASPAGLVARSSRLQARVDRKSLPKNPRRGRRAARNVARRTGVSLQPGREERDEVVDGGDRGLPRQPCSMRQVVMGIGRVRGTVAVEDVTTNRRFRD